MLIRCILLKEKHIAQVIYILTKPEDVTRRNVSRILFLHKKHSNRQKHTTALLSYVSIIVIHNKKIDNLISIFFIACLKLISLN